MVSVLPQLVKVKEAALDLLYPQRCLGCGKEGDFICLSCRNILPQIMPPVCPKCGRPQASGILCPSCVRWQAKIDGIRAPFRFDGVIRQAVYQLKYQNLRALVTPLAQLLHSYLMANPVPGEILVPVPLHQKRLKERGYNQSALLANKLGKLSHWPIVANCLARERYAPPQARTKTVIERQNNVTQAFVCRDLRLRNKRVILVDDVATSGATLDACAAALKTAGAVSVWGLVLAREI